MPRLSCSHVASLLVLAAASLLPACASSASKAFESKWDTAPAIVADASKTIAGKWEGNWQSNGQDYFNGRCQAVITPEPTSMNLPTDPPGKRYRVDIREFYSNLVPRDFAFAIFLTPGQSGKAELTGEKDFGPLADGLCKFEGDAEGRSLFLTFTTVKDYGTITLRRWPPEKP